MANKKIKFSDKDILPDGEIKTKDCKIRITTYIDLDVIEELKNQAAKEGENEYFSLR